ncbi:MAG: siderophore-interacting protein [Gammaproteobacteria bacterium]|jgi:NADPH-dependent ferric siderophore reductase|nr:siderophore-interacting protein [Gammaproteobacteria bacterium]MBT3734404.1 siderophore-interacting protein [Gammaproteobacteria bacterium]
MAKTARRVSVAKKQTLTPNMTRLVLEGTSLSDFPLGFEGGYIKLVLPDPGKPTVRSYTVRSFEPSTPQLTIDMVAHGDTGPAATWANQVTEGTNIEITGPGACQPINANADWFLLAGDMSALPAISVNVSRLPQEAVGDVVLEVISAEDQLELNFPPGLNVHWVINPDPEAPNSVLEDTVMAIPWRDGNVSVWVAGEFSASRALRQYFRHDRNVEKGSMYVSCYWKIGETDEGMKAAKRADVEPW